MSKVIAWPVQGALLLATSIAIGACASHTSEQPSPRFDVDSTLDGDAPRIVASSRTSISGDNLRDVQSVPLAELIARRAPGVEVIRGMDGEYTLRLRGASMYRGSIDEPLIVIDGARVRGRTLGDALRAVQSADVVRVQILRDAEAAAAYGPDAVNGAIVIVTRKQ